MATLLNTEAVCIHTCEQLTGCPEPAAALNILKPEYSHLITMLYKRC